MIFTKNKTDNSAGSLGLPSPPPGQRPSGPAAPPPPMSTSSLLSSLPPTRVPFYKNSFFLIGFFIFLLVTIPLVIYFGVKKQQSLRGRAQVSNNCENAPNQCVGLAESECYSHAGSGCGWKLPDDPNKPHWEGSCYCAAGLPTSTPPPTGSANITCSVGVNGVTFTNSGEGAGSKSVSGTWCQSTRDNKERCEQANNNYECNNSGPFTASSGVLQPGESKTVGVGQVSCGIWQIDTTECGTDKGCAWDESICNLPPTVTPTGPVDTPTPTPTILSGVCRAISIYDTNGTPITDYSTIRAEQVIRLAVSGSSLGFDHGRFRVNGGSWLPDANGTAQTNSSGEFYFDYTVPTGVKDFRVEAMVHHSTLGWK